MIDFLFDFDDDAPHLNNEVYSMLMLLKNAGVLFEINDDFSLLFKAKKPSQNKSNRENKEFFV